MARQDIQADRPADGADWVAAAADSFEQWLSARDMKALSRSAAILNGAAQRMIVDPERAQLAIRIGEALLQVSIDQARPDVLDYAIGLLSREMSFIPSDLDPRGAALLAICQAALLTERFYLSGRLEDLAAAMDLYAANASFVEAIPEAFEDRDRAWFWWGFGKAHWRKSDVAGQHLELVAAVDCLSKAVQALSAESAFGRQIRGDFAVAQMEFIEAKDKSVDRNAAPEFRASLETAIDTLRGLTKSTSSASEGRQWYQNLAGLLLRRSSVWPEGDAHRTADLRDALAACEAGLQTRTASEWDKVQLFSTRAECHRRLAANRIDATLEEAYVAAVDAARRSEHAELLPLASNWQRLLGEAGRWRDAASLGDSSLPLLEKLVRSQPHQYYKLVYLRQGVGLAEATAVAHARSGSAEGAITSLERTLAVVWRERYFQPRSLAKRLLSAGAPDLAEQYLDLIARARAIDAPDSELRKTEGELAELQSSIDDVLGSGDVRQAQAIASGDGANAPSLHLVTSTSGSLALLRDEQGRVAAIDLPMAPAATVYEMAARFRENVVSGEAGADLTFSTVEEIVAWLQTAVLKPIEGQILGLLTARGEGTAGHDELSDAPRTLTVVTTGPYSGLPLHAAKLGDGRPSAVLGFAYAPMLAVRDAPGLDPGPSVLIVADPAREGQVTLEGAIQELATLSAVWPDAHVLSGHSATRSAVLAALPAASLIHLACHGMSDDGDPLNSLVVLADGDITMRNVLSIQLRPGCLVVLSACQTAVHDPSVPNEAMSLAMGFLAAGAATVVASLWPVADDPTAALMGAFHQALRSGMSPARALGAAQSAMATGQLTDSFGGVDWRSPYYWAGFVAIGK